MADEEDMPQLDVLKEAKTLGKVLNGSLKSKDALLKALKKAGDVLERAQQQSVEQREALADAAQFLRKKEILNHKDKDVKLRAAFCLCHVLRMHAPDHPYELKIVEAVLGLFLQVFRRLDNPLSPSFQLCLSVLDIVSQTKCCLLAYDLTDPDNYVCDLFDILLNVISEDNAQAIEGPTLLLLSSMLEEGDGVSQRILDVILGYLVAPKKNENPAAHRCSTQIILRNEAQLQPYIQKLLTNLMDGNKTESAFEDDFAELLPQVYKISPHILLPLIPRLTSDLRAKDISKRTAAMDLMGKLFALPDSQLHQDSPELLTEFLGRSRDQKAEVRQKWLQMSTDVLLMCPCMTSRDEVLGAMKERLMDFEEKAVDLATIEDISERLRDKSEKVARSAALHLMKIFRSYCTKSHNGALVGSEEELVIWVPARVLLCASKSADLAQYVTADLFREGIFPGKLPADVAARQWTAIYMSSHPQERTALMAALTAHANLQQAARTFLSLRTAKPGADVDKAEERFAKVVHYIARTASFVVGEKAEDHAKSEENLQKLRELKDNNIFKSLAALLDATSLEEAAKLSKDVVQRVGSRGLLAGFVKTFCERLSPRLVSPQHVHELLGIAGGNTLQDDAFLSAVLALLCDVAAAAPSLFSGAATQVLDMLHKDDCRLKETAARILSHAGASARSEAATALDEAKEKLLHLCEHGSAKAAKAAVRALNGILPSSEHEGVLKPLCERLVQLLDQEDIEPQLPAILQALSSIGRIAPHIFAEHAAAVADFVLHVLLPAERVDTDSQSSARLGKVWGSFSDTISLKAFAIKAFARALVPDRAVRVPPETEELVDAFIGELLPLLDVNNDMEELCPCGTADVALMRLAASAALLRLARAHDSRIHPEIFIPLALTVQDPLMEVRAAFTAKVRRLVMLLHRDTQTVQKASKYAAVLPLAGMDPSVQNRVAAYGMLCDYVIWRRTAASRGVAAAAQEGLSGGSILQQLPEFMLPYAIQILAHHPDFPTRQEVESGDLENLSPFSKMMQFLLEPLILAASRSNNADPPGATLPAIDKVLRTIKYTEDATAEPATQNMYMLCDMTMALANAIVERHCPGSAAQGRFPAGVPLPKSFFRQLDRTMIKEKTKDASYLPPGFEAVLQELCPNQLQPPGAQTKGHARTKQPKEPRQRAPRKTTQAATARDGGSARKLDRPKRKAAAVKNLAEPSTDIDDDSDEDEASEEDAAEKSGRVDDDREEAAAGPDSGSNLDGALDSGGKQKATKPKRASRGTPSKRAKRASAADEDAGPASSPGRESPNENAQPQNGPNAPAGKRAAAAQDEKGASAWDMPSDDDDWAAQGTGGKRSARKTPPSKGRMSKAGKVSAALAIALANTSHHGGGSSPLSPKPLAAAEDPPKQNGRPGSGKAGRKEAPVSKAAAADEEQPHAKPASGKKRGQSEDIPGKASVEEEGSPQSLRAHSSQEEDASDVNDRKPPSPPPKKRKSGRKADGAAETKPERRNPRRGTAAA